MKVYDQFAVLTNRENGGTAQIWAHDKQRGQSGNRSSIQLRNCIISVVPLRCSEQGYCCAALVGAPFYNFLHFVGTVVSTIFDKLCDAMKVQQSEMAAIRLPAESS